MSPLGIVLGRGRGVGGDAGSRCSDLERPRRRWSRAGGGKMGPEGQAGGQSPKASPGFPAPQGAPLRQRVDTLRERTSPAQDAASGRSAGSRRRGRRRETRPACRGRSQGTGRWFAAQVGGPWRGGGGGGCWGTRWLGWASASQPASGLPTHLQAQGRPGAARSPHAIHARWCCQPASAFALLGEAPQVLAIPGVVPRV